MTQAQPLYVALGVISVCGIAAIPLWFQSVRKREQLLAQARYGVFVLVSTQPSCSRYGDAGARQLCSSGHNTVQVVCRDEYYDPKQGDASMAKDEARMSRMTIRK